MNVSDQTCRHDDDLQRETDNVTGYCGNSLNAGSVEAPVTDCSMVCAGDAFSYCGNGNRLELYKLTSAPSTTAAEPSTEGEPT